MAILNNELDLCISEFLKNCIKLKILFIIILKNTVIICYNMITYVEIKWENIGIKKINVLSLFTFSSQKSNVYFISVKHKYKMKF